MISIVTLNCINCGGPLNCQTWRWFGVQERILEKSEPELKRLQAEIRRIE
jgi:hypothetical protein